VSRRCGRRRGVRRRRGNSGSCGARRCGCASRSCGRNKRNLVDVKSTERTIRVRLNRKAGELERRRKTERGDFNGNKTPRIHAHGKILVRSGGIRAAIVKDDLKIGRGNRLGGINVKLKRSVCAKREGRRIVEVDPAVAGNRKRDGVGSRVNGVRVCKTVRITPPPILETVLQRAVVDDQSGRGGNDGTGGFGIGTGTDRDISPEIL